MGAGKSALQMADLWVPLREGTASLRFASQHPAHSLALSQPSVLTVGKGMNGWKDGEQMNMGSAQSPSSPQALPASQ